MQELSANVFDALRRENIPYCLLRDGHQLDRLDGGGEVDLLVDDGQLPRLEALLARFGFVRLRAWGHFPHQFFVAYDEPSGGWLKFDVVTTLAYGRPTRSLCLPLAEGCLARRDRCGPVFVLSAEDELITLLLHCVLDKGYFAPARRKRICDLRRRLGDPRRLAQLLRTSKAPGASWSNIAYLIDTENWPALLAESNRIAAHWARRDRIGILARRVRDRLLRKLHRWFGVIRPRALSVAVVAPDGAGKSTVIASVEKSFYFPSRSIYMGLYPKRPAARAGRRMPGIGLAANLIRQWGRCLAGRYHRARGRMVLFDRYAYDALIPPAKRPGRLGRWRRRLLAAACPAPDLVVMLDAPGKMLFSRKQEHSAAILERQRQGYLELRQRLPQMVVVDATTDVRSVCRRVTSLIWQCHAQRLQRGCPRSRSAVSARVNGRSRIERTLFLGQPRRRTSR